MRVKEMKIIQKLTVQKLTEIAEHANRFESDIKISVGENKIVDAKSVMGLLAILRTGSEVTIRARGIDEEEAIRTFMNLLL